MSIADWSHPEEPVGDHTLSRLALVAACGGDASSADTTDGASSTRTSGERSSAAEVNSDGKEV